jgi:hypothetical protein
MKRWKKIIKEILLIKKDKEEFNLMKINLIKKKIMMEEI